MASRRNLSCSRNTPSSSLKLSGPFVTISAQSSFGPLLPLFAANCTRAYSLQLSAMASLCVPPELLAGFPGASVVDEEDASSHHSDDSFEVTSEEPASPAKMSDSSDSSWMRSHRSVHSGSQTDEEPEPSSHRLPVPTHLCTTSLSKKSEAQVQVAVAVTLFAEGH
jgi:hypothetical protein